MKHLFTIISIFYCLMPLIAQERCPSPVAIENQITVVGKSQIADFTITDTDGNELNLYATLNQGKTVLLDLFYTTCGYCIQYSPIIEQVYQMTGAGQGDVLFWGISPQDNNAQINAYKIAHNVSNPCAGTQGNGPNAITIINTGQNFTGYPTYIVVCPDKNMQYDVCYPPSTNCLLGKINYCSTILFPKFATTEDTVFTTHEVMFSDSSTGQPTSWLWEFEGGTPASSTDQNPVIIYENEGTFDVSLSVTNATGNQTTIKTDYITAVLNVGNKDYTVQNSIRTLLNASQLIVQINNNNKAGILNMYNISGQLVYNEKVDCSSQCILKIPITNLSKGIYLIRLASEGYSESAKVLIK